MLKSVRPAVLSDFLSTLDLMGSLRERMATLCGDDSALDALNAAGDKVFNTAVLRDRVATALDDFAAEQGVDLSALAIVDGLRVVTV